MNFFDDFNHIEFEDLVEFYEHEQNWSNRMILGDSLLVMNSLAQREALKGKVQMIYMDPPYGIKFNSNFQWSTTSRDVKDGKADHITREPEQVKAFRDTWRDGIHTYLTYLRDRLCVCRDLLGETGSVFVQIGNDNLHRVRLLLDEVFGEENFVSMVQVQKTGSQASRLLANTVDFILWYAKTRDRVKYRPCYGEREAGHASSDRYDQIELAIGVERRLSKDELARTVDIPEGRIFQHTSLVSSGATSSEQSFQFRGIRFEPGPNNHWKTTVEGLARLGLAGRLAIGRTTIRYKRYLADFALLPLNDRWESLQIGTGLTYVVETAPSVIQRCIIMTTDPGDLVLDPTCGSGTTAYVAEQWGRRWITCDTSRIAITLAKQRLMTALFDYYELAHPEEGVSSGFRYKTVPHITLKSIANNPEIKEGMSRKEIDAAIKKYADQETLYDQPFIDNSKARVTGPFTVEAVPAPVVKPLMEIESDQPADASISRSGETLRQAEWRDEILKTGIRARSGEKILFSRVEPLQGTHWLHAEAETREDTPQKAVISFGPEYAPLEQRQVALAIEESLSLVPKPKVIIFAAFEFDPEAAKDVDETNWPGITLLKAKMSEDLLTEDLKKKRASNDSFWLIGQPDILLEKIKEGDDKGKYWVEVLGFDYYNPRTGTVDSGGAERIAMWMLDTDYDGRSLFPRQIFFPMSGPKDGWSKLARNLKAEIDEDLIQAYHGHLSLPFEPGPHERIAVKIVDDRGIESLKLMDVR